MPRITPLSINVAKPCHQSWESMMPNAEGRHCNECSKTVVDFTNYSDAELVAYFSNLQGKVCGRFRASQLSRSLHIPPQPHSRLYRLTVALGLTLLFSQSTATFAQSTKEPSWGSVSSARSKGISGEKRVGALTGRVSDSLGHPVANASVHFYCNGNYRKMVYTNSGGEYFVKELPYGLYNIFIEADGFDVRTVDSIHLHADTVTVHPVVLTLYRSSGKTASEVFVTGEPAIDSIQNEKELMGKIKVRPDHKKTHNGRRR